MALPADTVALEITPPASPRLPVLLRRARGLEGVSARVNVIQRPERQSSLAASIALRAHGLAPVWHLSSRGRSRFEVEALIERAARAGIDDVLCVRGEYKPADESAGAGGAPSDAPKIREIVRMLDRGIPGIRVSVTLNHHGRRDRVLANLLPKLAAGARAVQTQVTFDLESLRPFAEEVVRRFPEVSVAPMLLPVLSPRAALRVSRRLGVPVPAALMHRLEVLGEHAGWEHFDMLLGEIARNPLYRGVALMTPMDPRPEFLSRLRSVVRERVSRPLPAPGAPSGGTRG